MASAVIPIAFIKKKSSHYLNTKRVNAEPRRPQSPLSVKTFLPKCELQVLKDTETPRSHDRANLQNRENDRVSLFRYYYKDTKHRKATGDGPRRQWENALRGAVSRWDATRHTPPPLYCNVLI